MPFSATPLFDEWVSLAGSATLEELTSSTGATAVASGPITSEDALVVIDMQRDFVPRSATNKDGGRLGCPEGELVIAPVVDLIRHAASVGATIIASRDYHPHDHCSFASVGGPFPAHCVQGSAGSKFLPAVARALEDAMARNGPARTVVVFKAMHEAVDSFGAMPYAKAPFGAGRVVSSVDTIGDAARAGFREHGACMGCTDAPWTGSLVLKQSAIAHVAEELAQRRVPVAGDGDGGDDGSCDGSPADDYHGGVRYDADAPPDVLAVLRDGMDRKMRTMEDVLRANLGDTSTGRIFVCGLTLDLCVHDTCVNARALGLERVALVVDAARAAHVAGVGAHGSGFLADPAGVRLSLEDAGVRLVHAAQLLPEGLRRKDSVAGDAGLKFPEQLGALSLRAAAGLRIQILATAPLRHDPSSGEEGGGGGKQAAAAAAEAEKAATDATASPHRETGGDGAAGTAAAAAAAAAAAVPTADVAASPNHGAGRYSLALVGALAPLAGGGGGARAFRNTGIVSPRAPLPADWPGAAQHPTATHVCWAYPMADVSPARLGAEASKAFMAISASAELRFAAYGGFLLLDAAGKVVAAQAVGDESDSAARLAFAPPKEWRSDFTAQLEAERRLQKVTLPALLARGAARFCWLGPGETFAAGAERWQPTATGGFLYLRSGGDAEQPLYFPREVPGKEELLPPGGGSGGSGGGSDGGAASV